jgi:hypothetical protein
MSQANGIKIYYISPLDLPSATRALQPYVSCYGFPVPEYLLYGAG